MGGSGGEHRRVSIPVMQVPHPCPPTYNVDELWHQNQRMRYTAYEDTRQLFQRTVALEEQLRRRDEIIKTTRERLAEMSISYQTELDVQFFIVLLQSIISGGVNGIVFVLYEHLLSTLILSALAFFFERITLCQLLLTSSLEYISATFQSIALNTTTAVVFVLALHGLAALNKNHLTGGIMVACSILATATWIILVERVAAKYPSKLCMSAMMSLFGTLQVAVVAIVGERDASSWKLHLDGSFELLAIVYGGIVVTGFSYYAQTWCIDKKGPVFTSAFSPLLIVFSFLLETLFLGKAAHRILGSVLVVVGLYLILWAKTRDSEKKKIGEGNICYSPLISPTIEP
ncbi:hypothetical protein GIB67_026104 [Kingdonia uniflora]|uniref:WAT1-related protein n=1 Tax=Kingdonia uniflora TaxID=39325 RepID=A0A7J7M389_9MAGN|nr:hypothetical protein GIB67_026104 [Kingdonia uniflora]